MAAGCAGGLVVGRFITQKTCVKSKAGRQRVRVSKGEGRPGRGDVTCGCNTTLSL